MEEKYWRPVPRFDEVHLDSVDRLGVMNQHTP